MPTKVQHNSSAPRTDSRKVEATQAKNVAAPQKPQAQAAAKPVDSFDTRSSKPTASTAQAQAVAAIRAERVKDPAVEKAILGALVSLDATQVRDRPGKQSSTIDWSGGDGHRVEGKLAFGNAKPVLVPMPFLKVQNFVGEWSNDIHFGMVKPGGKPATGKLPLGVPDSNMFVTSFVAHPLTMIDDKALPQDQRFVSHMRRLAVESIKPYRRGAGFSFWREHPATNGTNTDVIGPTNIKSKQLSGMAAFATHPLVKKVFGKALEQLDPNIRSWLERVNDPKDNPQGGDAFFNIPNDADDTSVAVALLKMASRDFDPNSKDPYYRDPANFVVDTSPLDEINKHRDLNRTKSLDFDSWKGTDSGAALTWLKDENAPTFADPESGVIPSAINLVDEVVNANVVFAMALNGKKDLPVYASAVDLLAKVASTGRWMEHASAYYPQRMMFPYSVSRAWRDGGATDPVMRQTMKDLLRDTLKLQQDYAKKHPEHAGAFPGGVDTSTGLSTAMGFVFLLNAGEELAAEIGMLAEYRSAVEQSKAYLLKTGKPMEAQGPGGAKVQGMQWQEGTFFQGDPQAATQWVSGALTTSIVLEGMSKYAMGFDKDSKVGVDDSRLRLTQKAGGGFAIDVSATTPNV